MASLYKLSADYAALLDAYDMEEAEEVKNEIISQLANTEGAIDDKADVYAKIIRMIHEIRMENARRIDEGKKPCAADEAIQAEAERLLHQEFSYVLHLSVEDTVAFVVKELGIQ